MQVLEETGLKITADKFAALENTVFNSKDHYITIFQYGELEEVGWVPLMSDTWCVGSQDGSSTS